MTSLLFLKGNSQTINCNGRVVGVVGEAGIDKSRLCFELADNCRRQGIRVIEARVLAHGRAIPFQPVLALLRDIFGVQASESAEVSRRRVIDRFAALSGSESLLLVLLDFLGLAEPSKPTVKTDPKTRKMQLLDLVRTLARSAATEAATVVQGSPRRCFALRSLCPWRASTGRRGPAISIQLSSSLFVNFCSRSAASRPGHRQAFPESPSRTWSRAVRPWRR